MPYKVTHKPTYPPNLFVKQNSFKHLIHSGLKILSSNSLFDHPFWGIFHGALRADAHFRTHAKTPRREVFKKQLKQGADVLLL